MTRSIGLAVVVLVLLVACDRDGDERPSATVPPPSTSPAPTLSAEGFLYTSTEGIRALATFRGARGTLAIENETGGELASPGLYLLHATTGAIVDVQVARSRPVGDGQQHVFGLRLARAMPAASIGLVVLTLGDDDLGAFLPPAAAEAAA